jgi:8-oxo-dGTP diphosphatase
MKNKLLKCNIGEYAVILNNKKEILILLLKATKKYPKEKWMLPGGRLGIDDQPEQGLKREIFEETGLKVKVITPCHTARWGSENPPKYVVFYLCKLMGSQKIRLNHEHIDYKWISFKDISKISFHNINSKLAIKKANKK